MKDYSFACSMRKAVGDYLKQCSFNRAANKMTCLGTKPTMLLPSYIFVVYTYDLVL